MSTTMAPSKKRTPNPWTPKRLKALRADLGDLTQAQAAERIGVSTRAWVSWETATRIPSQAAARLLKLLSSGDL